SSDVCSSDLKIPVFCILRIHFKIVIQQHGGGNAHVLDPCRLPVNIPVIEIGWQWKLDLVKHSQVGGIGHPCAVSRFVTDNQAERFSPIAILQPTLGRLGDQVRNVSFDALPAAVHK